MARVTRPVDLGEHFAEVQERALRLRQSLPRYTASLVLAALADPGPLPEEVPKSRRSRRPVLLRLLPKVWARMVELLPTAYPTHRIRFLVGRGLQLLPAPKAPTPAALPGPFAPSDDLCDAAPREPAPPRQTRARKANQQAARQAAKARARKAAEPQRRSGWHGPGPPSRPPRVSTGTVSTGTEASWVSAGESLVGRGVCLGPSLIGELDRMARAAKTTRSQEAVRLTWLALSAPAPPPMREDRYLTEYGRGDAGGWRKEAAGGRCTIWAPEGLWERVRARARYTGESNSEALRALLHGGLVCGSQVEPGRDPEAEAVEWLKGHPLAHARDVASALWPALPAKRAVFAAVLVLARLRRQGLASCKLQQWSVK